MTRSDTCAGVAVEVLVEEHEILPVRVVAIESVRGVHRPAALAVLQENAGHSARDLGGHLPERHHRSGAGRALDLEVVAEIVVELLERLDEQEIHREPDWPAPVRVAPEEAGG